LVDYLFNSSGEWICFKVNKFIWDTNGNIIGWLPWGDNDVVTMEGDYLGTIVDKDRIYYFSNHPYRGYPGYPGYPGYLGYPGYPGFAGYKSLPSGAKDIVIKK
jgi:hypothetical protein